MADHYVPQFFASSYLSMWMYECSLCWICCYSIITQTILFPSMSCLEFGIFGNLLFLQKLKCSFTGTTSNNMGLHEHGILLKLNSSPLILPVWRCSIHQTFSLSPSSSLSLVSSLFSLDPHLVWNQIKLDRDTQLCRYVFIPLQVCPKTKWRIVLHLSKVIYLVTNGAQQGGFLSISGGFGSGIEKKVE